MMQNLPALHGIEKNTSDEQQQPLQQQQIPSTSLSQPPMEFGVPHTRLELGHSAGAAYPYAGPYFGNIVAAYGAQAMIHPHMLEVQQAGLPLPSDRIEEPVYVNAKQYCGILRRRQSRAKAESKNKLIKCRKPYLHESRHLHALRRARGCGGRFLNTKKNARHQDVVSGNNNSHNCTGEDSMVGMPDSEDVKRIQETGSVAHMVNSTSAIHSGRVSSTGQVGPSASVSNGTCYNHHHRQGFHSSAFHPISVANAESGQVGGLVSNGGHHAAVATR